MDDVLGIKCWLVTNTKIIIIIFKLTLIGKTGRTLFFQSKKE